MRFLVLKKRNIYLVLGSIFVLGLFLTWWFQKPLDQLVLKPESAGVSRDIHLVTGEFKATLKNGKEIEAYRWDPGTIFMEKGENVNLIIYGVNGQEHPFHVEGTKIRGIVKKGEETIVPLSFKKEGVYRLICDTHPDKDHNGPMIAYIVVD